MLSIREVPAAFSHHVAPREVVDIQNDLSVITDSKTAFLPIETVSSAGIDKQIGMLRAEMSVATRELDKDFPRINMDFMKINKKVSVPVYDRFFERKMWIPSFSIFDINQKGECDFRINQNNVRGDHLRSYFDFSQMCKRLESLRGYVDICDKFDGLLPARTRRIIKENQNRFDNIYIVKEATWSVMMHIPDPDPLVIGRTGHVHHLIDVFDQTTLEQHVADLYASRKPAL